MSDNKFEINLTEDLSELEKRLLQDEILVLPQIDNNNIDFHTLYLCEVNEFIECKLIIRTTVNNPVFLDKMTFSMVEGDKTLGQETVGLGFLGELPPFSATLATILLNKYNFNIDNVELTKCKLMPVSNMTSFGSQKVVVGYVDNSLEEVDKRLFEKLIEEFPPIKEDSYEIVTPRIFIYGNKVTVPVIIFNGYKRPITLKNIKITLKDMGLNIVKALKNLEELPVDIKPHTANVYNFVFEASEIFGSIQELKTCKVEITG